MRSEGEAMAMPARDRRYLRDVYDGQWLLTQLGHAIRGNPSRPDRVLRKVADGILHFLHPRRVEVFLLDEPWPSLAPEEGANARRRQVEHSGSAASYVGYLARPAGQGPQASPPHDDLLVPLAAGGGILGYLALGPKRSGAPYSRPDRELLMTVGEQLAGALDHFRLTERLARQRVLEREVEIAKDVQSRLLPQEPPRLPGLALSAECRQAREVGGDYFDFIALDPGTVGIALGDISGKGISAALLMASLQAHLRSQYSIMRGDLGRLFEAVNRQFCRSIGSSRFATLFFGHFDDSGGRLRYVNCGHTPPILLRADGRVERLKSTATILGAFPDWNGSVREIVLKAGDTLVVCSDGITEAVNEAGVEFGEERLIEVLRVHGHRSIGAIRRAVLGAATGHGGDEQGDDQTVLVARRTHAGGSAGETEEP
jgi:serine phosphatase RsbU (regulator of sigma subunit)